MPPAIISRFYYLRKVCYKRFNQAKFQKTDVGDKSEDIFQELTVSYQCTRDHVKACLSSGICDIVESMAIIGRFTLNY